MGRSSKGAKTPQTGRAPSTPKNPWDFGASGPANRDRLVEEERGHIDEATGRMVNPNRRRGVRRETWVDRYERKGKLTSAQAVAARWLRDLSEGRGSQDPLAALSGPVDGGAFLADPQAAAFDRRRMFFRLWRDLPVNVRPVLERVVLHDRPLRSLCGSGQQEQRQLDRLRHGLEAVRDIADAWR